MKIMEVETVSYSHIIKTISCEEVLGSNFVTCDLEQLARNCVKDALNSDKMAAQCLNHLTKKCDNIRSLLDWNYFLPLWLPSPLNEYDPFLKL